MESHTPTKSSAHLVELLDAALPYVNGNARHSMELVRKASDLVSCLSVSPQTSDLSACDLNGNCQPVDIEGLLENLHKVSNHKEKDMIHMMLNFIKARNLYSSYQNFQQTHTTPSEDVLSAASVGTNTAKGNHSNTNMLLEFLLSQLSPEQQKNFEMIQTLL